jgi:3-deoxy-D-manno-octulosonic-acid transferase/heptosyltransferase-1
MNILIVKLSAIGDVIHALPSLTALRKLYPDAHITWVIEEAAADLIVGHPDLDRVLVSSRKAWLEDFRQGKIRRASRGFRMFVRELRDRHYDIVIDFHGLLKSAVIVALSSGERKIGYNSIQESSGLFYNERIPEDMSKHAVDRYLDFIRYLNGNTKLPDPVQFRIPIDNANRRRVEALLMEHGLDSDQPFVAVNPLALWETKLWSAEKFAQLSDRIIHELGVPVVLTGAKSEDTGTILQKMRSVPVDLGAKTSLRDLAALYERASVLVTTDSGPMHIAAAMGTPVIALFGPTDPTRTGPYGEGHTVIRKDLACSPCFKKECLTRECLEAIRVEEVFEAVKKSL